jgi:hypothetical protein
MIQSWNKFCFTGGYIEVSVSLPGVTDIVGLWPAVWTMGNLGRAGYGASLEGMVCLFFLLVMMVFVEYPTSLHSGLIAMMRVMLVPLQTSQSVGNLLQQPSTGTQARVAFYHTLLVNVCHGVHAKENRIQDQCIQMRHT